MKSINILIGIFVIGIFVILILCLLIKFNNIEEYTNFYQCCADKTADERWPSNLGAVTFTGKREEHNICANVTPLTKATCEAAGRCTYIPESSAGGETQAEVCVGSQIKHYIGDVILGQNLGEGQHSTSAIGCAALLTTEEMHGNIPQSARVSSHNSYTNINKEVKDGNNIPENSEEACVGEEEEGDDPCAAWVSDGTADACLSLGACTYTPSQEDLNHVTECHDILHRGSQSEQMNAGMPRAISAPLFHRTGNGFNCLPLDPNLDWKPHLKGIDECRTSATPCPEEDKGYCDWSRAWPGAQKSPHIPPHCEKIDNTKSGCTPAADSGLHGCDCTKCEDDYYLDDNQRCVECDFNDDWDWPFFNSPARPGC